MAAWPSCRPPHLRVSGELLGWSPHSAASHMQHYKRKLISLIYTPTMTNESIHIPKEGQPPRRNPSPAHPYLEEETHASPQEKVRSGSPLLTRALVDKRCCNISLVAQSWRQAWTCPYILLSLEASALLRQYTRSSLSTGYEPGPALYPKPLQK